MNKLKDIALVVWYYCYMIYCSITGKNPTGFAAVRLRGPGGVQPRSAPPAVPVPTDRLVDEPTPATDDVHAGQDRIVSIEWPDPSGPLPKSTILRVLTEVQPGGEVVVEWWDSRGVPHEFSPCVADVLTYTIPL